MNKGITLEGYHHKYLKTVGTHCAGYQTRTIEQCLNCKRPKCNGCPKGKEEE